MLPALCCCLPDAYPGERNVFSAAAGFKELTFVGSIHASSSRSISSCWTQFPAGTTPLYGHGEALKLDVPPLIINGGTSSFNAQCPPLAVHRRSIADDIATDIETRPKCRQ